MSDQDQRVGRLLQRLQKLPTVTESNNLSHITTALTKLDQQLKQYRAQNDERFTSIADKLRATKRRMEEYSLNREKRQQEVLNQLSKTQQNCSTLINQYTLQRTQLQNSWKLKMDQHLKQFSATMQRIKDQDAHIYQQLVEYEQTLPLLNDQFKNIQVQRQQIEQTLYSSFADKLTRLKIVFDRECSQRKQQYQALSQSIKRVGIKLGEQLRREQADREQNQSLLLQVIQQTINRIAQMD